MLATLLLPIHHLPPELLGEIFHYCLPQDYHKEGALQAVMVTSHVCWHWKGVALSTPTLWMNIVLRVTNETFRSQDALVTTWFSQSGSLPLSFTLEGRESVQLIMAFLLQYCNRWQYIDLCIPFAMLWSLEVAKGHLQCLETMQITSITDPSYSIEHIFGSAPKLRELLLSCQLIWNGLSSSWAQLAELDISVFSTVGDCLTILWSMRNLQKLSFYVAGGIIGHHYSVISHLLVSFSVMGEAAHQLFGHITLPSLHELIVDKIDSGWLTSQFISFLETSSPRSFSFGILEMVNDRWVNYMVQVLQHIQSLHSLCLVYRFCEVGTGSFLEQLLPRIMDGLIV